MAKSWQPIDGELPPHTPEQIARWNWIEEHAAASQELENAIFEDRKALFDKLKSQGIKAKSLKLIMFSYKTKIDILCCKYDYDAYRRGKSWEEFKKVALQASKEISDDNSTYLFFKLFEERLDAFLQTE